MKVEDRVFTLKQLQEYLQISRPTGIKLLRSGKIKANKIGRDWRILKSEVDKYLRGEDRKN